MSDVFISYARQDRSCAEVLARALEEHGWSVWWDRSIPPGKSFDRVIEEALDSTKCLIVLWSMTSVTSDWVKTEAAEGTRCGILVPALIEDVTIPLEFRRIQAVDLREWSPAAPNPEFEKLLVAITAHVMGLEGRRSVAGGNPDIAKAVRAGRVARNKAPQSARKVSQRLVAKKKSQKGMIKTASTDWHARLIATDKSRRTVEVSLTQRT